MGKILGIVIGLLLAATAIHLFWRHEKVSPPGPEASPASGTTSADQGNNQSPSASRHDPAGRQTHALHSPTAQPTREPASDGSPSVSTAASEGNQNNTPNQRSSTARTRTSRLRSGTSTAGGTSGQPAHPRINDINLAPSRGILEDYAVFFAQAGLTPDEKKQFLAIMSEERAASRDIHELTKTTGLSADEQIQLIRQSMEQTRQDLATVLPNSKMSAYRDYRSGLAYRNLVESTSVLCAPEGEPISPETKETIIKTLRQTREFTPFTSTIRNNRDLARGDGLACNALAGLLTPKQLEAFRTTLAQRREEAAKRKATAVENR